MRTPWRLRHRPRRPAIAGAALGLLLLAACDRAAPPVPAESTATAVGTASPERAAAPPGGSGWDLDAGPLLVLATVGDGYGTGSLLRPDATDSTVSDTSGVGSLIGDGRLDLFGRSGLVAGARLGVEAAPQIDLECSAWPVARISVDGVAAVAPWTAAFRAGMVAAIPLDSIEGLAPRDSARLAVDLARIASRLPDDTSATFRGLPFVVLHAWQTRGLDSGFVVATMVRRVNQEDAPQEERVVLVVDTPAADAKRWTVGWHERAAGFEDELVVAEPLLAFRAAGGGPVQLLFGRDDGVALSAAVLSREGGAWRVRWESAIAGCR